MGAKNILLRRTRNPSKEIQDLVTNPFKAPTQKTKSFIQTFRGDLHHLQRPTWLIERRKERTTEQCSQPLKTMQLQVVRIELLKGAGLLDF